MAKQKTLTQHILEYLGETSLELLKIGADLVVNPHSFIRENEYQFRYSARWRSSQLNNFKYSKCFKKTSEGQYVLTSYGRTKALRYRVLQKQEKKWDGKYRAIAFDILEERRHDRDILRRELRILGCIELQKSFWITPYDIIEELLCLLKLWNIEMRGDVRVLIIQNIYDDKDLRKIFGL
ncbi:MAG: hypothetical protein Q8P71_02065 [bacterium]|nr:hypothetical protein [bacterium]